MKRLRASVASDGTAPGQGARVRQFSGADVPIALPRIVRVEVRKMFDTRSGFWLILAMGAIALAVSVAVVFFAPEEELTYRNFATAIGVPMAVLLPVMAILLVTSEWSQRSGLTTFTMIPRRGRVILAKAIATVGVGIGSIVFAGMIGALGNVAGSTIAGIDTVWDVSLSRLAMITSAQVLGMMMGFTLGVLIRNSAGAITGYCIYAFVAPTVFATIASFQRWFYDIQPWVDFNNTVSQLYDGAPDQELVARIVVSGIIWLVLPLSIGLITVRHSEVK